MTWLKGKERYTNGYTVLCYGILRMERDTWRGWINKWKKEGSHEMGSGDVVTGWDILHDTTQQQHGTSLFCILEAAHVNSTWDEHALHSVIINGNHVPVFGSSTLLRMQLNHHLPKPQYYPSIHSSIHRHKALWLIPLAWYSHHTRAWVSYRVINASLDLILLVFLRLPPFLKYWFWSFML